MTREIDQNAPSFLSFALLSKLNTRGRLLLYVSYLSVSFVIEIQVTEDEVTSLKMHLSREIGSGSSG